MRQKMDLDKKKIYFLKVEFGSDPSQFGSGTQHRVHYFAHSHIKWKKQILGKKIKTLDSPFELYTQ